MYMQNKKHQDVLVKNIFTLSMLVRKLSLYCNFLSKSKTLDYKHIKNEIQTIKLYIENIENLL